MSPATTEATPPALSRPGDCHRLGEVRPQSIQQGAVSRDADRHHPREGLSNGLLECQILGSNSQVSVPSVTTREDVATTPGPHGFLGTRAERGCAPLQWQLKAHWVDDLSLLVPVFRMQGVHHVVTSGGEAGIGSPSSSVPSFCTLTRQ